jgi:hypothetical protein
MAEPQVQGVKTISSGAQYTTLQKYFSHPSLVIYFFATPPIKLKLDQQINGGTTITEPPGPIIMIGTTNSEPPGPIIMIGTTTNSEPPGPIIMIDQSETLSSSRIIFITLFCAGAQHCCAFYQPPQQCFFLCFKFVPRVVRGCDKPLCYLQKKFNVI